MTETRSPSERRAMADAEVRRLGFPVPSHLPLHDPSPQVRVREVDAVARRACALNAIVAVTCGLPRKRGKAWVERNCIADFISPREQKVFSAFAGTAVKAEMQRSVEALWTLSWVLTLVPDLDHNVFCGQDLVTLLPDLKAGEPVEPFVSSSSLREKEALLLQQDILYCLHWGVVNADLRAEKRPGKVEGYVIEQRRRAIEWVLSDEDWNQVPMDT